MLQLVPGKVALVQGNSMLAQTPISWCKSSTAGKLKSNESPTSSVVGTVDFSQTTGEVKTYLRPRCTSCWLGSFDYNSTMKFQLMAMLAAVLSTVCAAAAREDPKECEGQCL